MKNVFAVLALFPALALGAPVTVLVTVSGKNLSSFSAPTSHFVATNPLCVQAMIVPQPAIFMKIATAPGKISVINEQVLKLEIPTEYPGNNFCQYKFQEASFSPVKTLESISLIPTEKALEPQADIQMLDLLSAMNSDIEVKCSEGTSVRYANGSQVGYSSGNVGYLYLNSEVLKNSSAPTAKFKLSF